MMLISLAAFVLALAPQPQSSVSSISSTFSARVARLALRIDDDAADHRISAAQATALHTQLTAAQQSSSINALDAVDTALAKADYELSAAENGQTIEVPLGADVLVAMHDEHTWQVENSNPSVLAPQVGVMWARGVQRGYVAKRAGTATLTASADNGTIVRFTVHVVMRK